MAENLYNPELYSHVIRRLDDGTSHTLTGFAKGEFFTAEYEGEDIHKVNVGIHENVSTFHRNRTLAVRVTYQFERLGATSDNAFMSELVNNGVRFSLSILGDFDDIRDSFLIDPAMVAMPYRQTHGTDADLTIEWIVTGRLKNAGQFLIN